MPAGALIRFGNTNEPNTLTLMASANKRPRAKPTAPPTTPIVNASHAKIDATLFSSAPRARIKATSTFLSRAAVVIVAKTPKPEAKRTMRLTSIRKTSMRDSSASSASATCHRVLTSASGHARRKKAAVSSNALSARGGPPTPPPHNTTEAGGGGGGGGGGG